MVHMCTYDQPMNTSIKSAMNLVQTPTDQLRGLPLAWAVALARGQAPNLHTFQRVTHRADGGSWVYSDGQFTDQEAVETVIREWITLERPSKGQTVPMWRAIADTKTMNARRRSQPMLPGMTPVEHTVVSAWGETYALAAMRAFAMSFLGEVAFVPEELVRNTEVLR